MKSIEIDLISRTAVDIGKLKSFVKKLRPKSYKIHQYPRRTNLPKISRYV